MNSKDMINNVKGMQDNINSNTARYNQLTTEVNERKTTIDTIQGKVNELNQKEYNVKVNIVNAMKSKGLNASTDDTYDTLANKLKTIDNTSTMYSYAMQVTYSYNVPNNASYGDIWIPLDRTDYKLVFTDSIDSITSPSPNEIYLTYNDAILEINFDTSINNYTTSTHKLNLQISSNTFIDNIEDDYIPVILSELNRYLVKPKATYKYSSTFTEFEAFWYNGRGWKPINYKRNPNLLLYGYSYITNIYAYDKDTLSRVWLNNNALNTGCDITHNCVAGKDLIAIIKNSNTSSDSCFLSFINMKGVKIKTDYFNYHISTNPWIQSLCYCSYNNSFIAIRNISADVVKLHKYNGTTGEKILTKSINVSEQKTIIACIGNKLFLSMSKTGNAEIIEVDADTFDNKVIHSLPSLRVFTTYQNYIYIVNYGKSSTSTNNNTNTVIDKYQYINGGFNLIKSATITTNTSYNYTKITMASNPTNHTPYVILGYGYQSGGYIVLDTDLNEVSRVTNSIISSTHQGTEYAKIFSFSDGRLAYYLEYRTYSSGYIGIFNLFTGANSKIVQDTETTRKSILLGTTTGLLNDFPYEY